MSVPLELLVLALLAYLVGSIPFGLLIARAVAGVDLRTVGSGNIGATNATRVLGKTWGAVVLLLDAAKGALPVLGLPHLFQLPVETRIHAAVLAGTMAIAGHMYSPWLNFRGGKGVATATGVVAILAPYGFAVALGVFLLTFLVTRTVSLGSIAACVAFAVTQCVVLGAALGSTMLWSLGLFSFGIPSLIIWGHRANISRLLRGEEHSFTTRAPSGPAASVPATPPAET